MDKSYNIKSKMIDPVSTAFTSCMLGDPAFLVSSHIFLN